MGLYRPKLDLDLDVSVSDLVAGCFGTKARMTALARKAGQVSSEAKSAFSNDGPGAPRAVFSPSYLRGLAETRARAAGVRRLALHVLRMGGPES